MTTLGSVLNGRALATGLGARRDAPPTVAPRQGRVDELFQQASARARDARQLELRPPGVASGKARLGRELEHLRAECARLGHRSRRGERLVLGVELTEQSEKGALGGGRDRIVEHVDCVALVVAASCCELHVGRLGIVSQGDAEPGQGVHQHAHGRCRLLDQLRVADHRRRMTGGIAQRVAVEALPHRERVAPAELVAGLQRSRDLDRMAVHDHEHGGFVEQRQPERQRRAGTRVLPHDHRSSAELSERGAAPVIVWKDPRTCTTLPFWLPLFDEPPVLVIVYRHPVEVAGSLETRNQLGRGHAFAVWERFNGDALRNATGHPTAVIRYAQLVEEPASTMRVLVDSLARFGVALGNDPETTDMELTAGRRHHESDAVDVFDDPIATASQRALFGLLGELDSEYESFAAPRPVPETSALSAEMLELAAKARFARRDARRAKFELSRVSGSRRRLLKELIDSTLPGRNGRRRVPTSS